MHPLLFAIFDEFVEYFLKFSFFTGFGCYTTSKKCRPPVALQTDEGRNYTWQASKYDGLARIIIQNVGGKQNIKAITHCITRLRFQLVDEGKANTDILNKTDG